MMRPLLSPLRRLLTLAAAGMLPFCAVAAPDALTPTELKSYGDCVTPRITAPMNALQTALDKLSCSRHNAGKPDLIKACEANSATRTEVTFFWDNCGSADGPFEISLGGKDIKLKKVESYYAKNSNPVLKRVPVAGLYEAINVPGLSVMIQPGKLLREVKQSDSEMGFVEFDVAVIVRKVDGSSDSINGIHGKYWRSGN